MTYALYEALRLVLEEGLENCFARHLLESSGAQGRPGGDRHRLRRRRRASAADAQRGARSPTASTTRRSAAACSNRFGIEIGGGLGAFKGKVWRIGLMGYGSRPRNVLLFLSALEQLLAEQGYAFDRGASIAAANAIYQRAG